MTGSYYMVLWLGKAEERNWMRPDTSWDYLKSSYSLGKHFHPFTTGFWVHMVRFREHFLWPLIPSILFFQTLAKYWACIPWMVLSRAPWGPSPIVLSQWLSMYSYLPTSIAFLGPKLRRMTFSLSLPHLFPSSNCWDLPALVVFAQVNKIVLELCPSLFSTVVIKTITKNDLERRNALGLYVLIIVLNWEKTRHELDIGTDTEPLRNAAHCLSHHPLLCCASQDQQFWVALTILS